MRQSDVVRALLAGDDEAVARRAALVGIDVPRPVTLAVTVPPGPISARLAVDMADHTVAFGPVDGAEPPPGIPVTVVTSSPGGALALRRAHGLALAGAKAARRAGLSGVVPLREALYYAALGGCADARVEWVDMVLGPLIHNQRRRYLLTTLEIVHHCGWDVALAAPRLCAHPNTVRERLKTAANLTGLAGWRAADHARLSAALIFWRLASDDEDDP